MSTTIRLIVEFTDDRDPQGAAEGLIDHLFETYNGDDSLQSVEAETVEKERPRAER